MPHLIEFSSLVGDFRYPSIYAVVLLRRVLEGTAGYLPEALWNIYHGGESWSIHPEHERPGIIRCVSPNSRESGWLSGLNITYRIPREALFDDSADWLQRVVESLEADRPETLIAYIRHSLLRAIEVSESEHGVLVGLRGFFKEALHSEITLADPREILADSWPETLVVLQVLRDLLHFGGFPCPDVAYGLADAVEPKIRAIADAQARALAGEGA